jgi:hypothetical protein
MVWWTVRWSSKSFWGGGGGGKDLKLRLGFKRI